MISSFFKSPKSKSFKFTPRYYDADKEAFEERKAMIAAELKEGSEIRSIRGTSLREKWEANKKTSNFSRKSNIRLVVIFTLLCAICYYILYT